MDKDQQQRLEYLYKEYARLNEQVEVHVRGGFDDFRLLGAIGAAIILWEPFSELIDLAGLGIDRSSVLFLRFLSLLFWSQL